MTEKQSKKRAYGALFDGKFRVVEAKSREAVRDFLMAPIIKQYQPDVEDITILTAAQLGRALRDGAEYEDADAIEVADQLLAVEDLLPGTLVHVTSEASEFQSGVRKLFQKEEDTYPSPLFFKVPIAECGPQILKLQDSHSLGQSFVTIPVVDGRGLIFRQPRVDELQSFLDLHSQ